MKHLAFASEEEKKKIINEVKVRMSRMLNIPSASEEYTNIDVPMMQRDEFFGEFLCNNTDSNPISIQQTNFAEIDNYISFKVPILSPTKYKNFSIMQKLTINRSFFILGKVYDLDTFNLMRWWFEHRNTFPHLFRMYLRNSSKTGTSAPSERAFSTTGRILDSRRTSLLPETINMLMLVRNEHMRTSRLIK